MRQFRFLLLFASLLLCACEDRKPPLPPPDQTYTLRADVTALPNPPKQALRLHHEAIPNFVGHDGKVEAMDEMEMEFPFLSPAAKLDGIAVNDMVEAVMEIRWKAEQVFLLTSIRKLPADTKLNLGDLGPADPAK
jgi:hypothetical protein